MTIIDRRSHPEREPEDETAWLVEMHTVSQTFYLTADASGFQWDIDVQLAIRCCREEDAKMLMGVIRKNLGNTSMYVAEHLWHK